MLQSEFIERTGFYPTYDEYKAIEEMYNSFDGNKDEFCAKFTNEKDTMLVRAREIACRRMQSEREKWMHERGSMQSEISHLKVAYEYEHKRCESIESEYKTALEDKEKDFDSIRKQNSYFIGNLQKNVDELNKEVDELRKQVEAFKRVVKIIN